MLGAPKTCKRLIFVQYSMTPSIQYSLTQSSQAERSGFDPAMRDLRPALKTGIPIYREEGKFLPLFGTPIPGGMVPLGPLFSSDLHPAGEVSVITSLFSFGMFGISLALSIQRETSRIVNKSSRVAIPVSDRGCSLRKKGGRQGVIPT